MTKLRAAKLAGLWAVTLFLALVCLRSGLTKLPAGGFWERDFRRWHYPGWFRLAVGVAELAACLLLVVPRFAAYGAALFALVMLGAIYTHAAHGETVRLPFNFLLLSLSLLVLYARRPRRQPSTAPGGARKAVSRESSVVNG